MNKLAQTTPRHLRKACYNDEQYLHMALCLCLSLHHIRLNTMIRYSTFTGKSRYSYLFVAAVQSAAARIAHHSINRPI